MPDVEIKKIDQDLHLVWGEVYAPDYPDSQGDFMKADEIQKMAHGFLKTGKQAKVDVNHDNVLDYDCCVVESFIARKDDPVYIAGSWVVAIHVKSDDIWSQIKDGTLNGFSMEVKAIAVESELDMKVVPMVKGETSKTDGHEHKFTVKFSDNGDFLGGVTDVVDGHSHGISKGSATETVDGHSHRFSFIEEIING